LQEKRRLELDEQKTRVVQAVKGLEMFTDEYIYENYFNMNEDEIKEMKDSLEQLAKEAQEAEMAQQAPMEGSELGGADMGEGDMGGPEV
jgi:hypothetical protein